MSGIARRSVRGECRPAGRGRRAQARATPCPWSGPLRSAGLPPAQRSSVSSRRRDRAGRVGHRCAAAGPAPPWSARHTCVFTAFVALTLARAGSWGPVAASASPTPRPPAPTWRSPGSPPLLAAAVSAPSTRRLDHERVRVRSARRRPRRASSPSWPGRSLAVLPTHHASRRPQHREGTESMLAAVDRRGRRHRPARRAGARPAAQPRAHPQGAARARCRARAGEGGGARASSSGGPGSRARRPRERGRAQRPPGQQPRRRHRRQPPSTARERTVAVSGTGRARCWPSSPAAAACARRSGRSSAPARSTSPARAVSRSSPRARRRSASRRCARSPATSRSVQSSAAWTDYGIPGSPYFVYVEDGVITGEGSATTWPQVRDLMAQAVSDRPRRAAGRARTGPGALIGDDSSTAASATAPRMDGELHRRGHPPRPPSLQPPTRSDAA